jgi:hypothetical protein
VTLRPTFIFLIIGTFEMGFTWTRIQGAQSMAAINFIFGSHEVTSDDAEICHGFQLPTSKRHYYVIVDVDVDVFLGSVYELRHKSDDALFSFFC